MGDSMYTQDNGVLLILQWPTLKENIKKLSQDIKFSFKTLQS